MSANHSSTNDISAKKDHYLKWAREIKQFERVKKQFALCGNIYDIFPYHLSGKNTTFKLVDYLKWFFEDIKFDLSLSYEPLIGFRFLKGSESAYNEICREVFEMKDPKKAGQIITIENIDMAANNIEDLLLLNKYKIALIIEWASFLPKVAQSYIQLNSFLYKMFRLSHNENIFQNRIVWLLNVDHDLPGWYTLKNMNFKSMIIPKPDYSIRKTVIEAITKNVAGYTILSQEDIDKYHELFVNQSHDQYAKDIKSIIDICKEENIGIGNISEIIKKYRFGIIENPWTKLLKEYSKIEKTESILKERVIGQDKAIQKAVDIINRAYFNLSGSQFSRSSQKPKGVLFLAGPTGVGKTELAKAITNHLFGSDTAFIRFDMSEFIHEHADQRLIGAPPGYIGHEIGGELTNKVKENPFCVLLFDEIEKAHNKIFDKFLQILDDGRITSGKGETVYFSESLIIFTSNLGVDYKDCNKTSYDELEERVHNQINYFFKNELKRPELRNRIGENVVVFDYIREKTGLKILDKMLENVISHLKETHNISINKPEGDVLTNLQNECIKDLSDGGRGIGNSLENVFMNPLCNALIEKKAKESDTYTIMNISKNEYGIWGLNISKV